MIVSELLTLGDCTCRANFSARATADALVRIDRILVAFADSLNRAVRLASSTCYTIITNYVCHCI
jgi:hypothetical protein